MQGPYGIKLTGTDADSGETLFCVDESFMRRPAAQQAQGALPQTGLHGGSLAGAVLRDAWAELRTAFEAANAAHSGHSDAGSPLGSGHVLAAVQ